MCRKAHEKRTASCLSPLRARQKNGPKGDRTHKESLPPGHFEDRYFEQLYTR